MKKKKSIEMHRAGKTTREIAVGLHISVIDIGRIIKKYEKNIQQNSNPQKIPPSISKSTSTKVYDLFLNDGSSVVL